MVLRVPVRATSATDSDLTGLLTDLLQETRLLRQRVEALSPAELLYTTFPREGGVEPLPSGVTVFNFRDGSVTAPDGIPSWGARRLSPDFDVLKMAQSAIIIPDSIVTVTITPGVGSFMASVNAPVFGRARRVEEVRIEADAPYNLYMVVGTSQFPPDVAFQGLGQMRYSDATLTKVNAAATADNWTNITLVPRWSTKVLPTAMGKSYIFSGGCLQKVLAIRNLGVVGAEVRVLGGMIPTVVLAMESLNVAGFILDPDVHVVGTPTENFVSIASGDQAVLETGIPWGIFRLQARVAAANLPGLPARLVTEYAAFTSGMR